MSFGGNVNQFLQRAPLKIKQFHTGGIVNERETAQMDARWDYIELTHPIKNANYDILPCGVCFAKLILDPTQ